MKTFKTLSAILLTATLLACGGGGGGGASNPSNNSTTTSYVVSTLVLSPQLTAPSAISGISIDSQGNLYVADSGANLVRKITNVNNSPLNVSTVLGGGNTSYSSCLNSLLDSPYGIVIDSSSHIYVTESNKTVVRYADCTASTTFSQEYGSLTAGLTLLNPRGVALYGSTLYVSDAGNYKIRAITDNGAHSGVTATLAGTSNGYVNGAAGTSAFSVPTGIAVASSGIVFVADTNNCAIRMISSGQVSTFAGSGPNNLGTGPVACGSADGTGTAALFDHPTGLAIDASDNLYVADSVNNRIRRITPQGVVTTIAGSGGSGSTDGAGSSATFNTPTGITIDSSGAVFVVDSGSNKIRKITVTP